MDLSDAPTNVFVSLDEDEAYAATSYLEWQLMVKQMENFELLKTDDIEPEKRDCEICYEPFSPSEQPIELRACGHVFGHACIFSWLAESIPMRKWWNCVAKDAHWPFPTEEVFRMNDEDEFQEALRYTNVDDVSIALQENGHPRPDWRDYLNWGSWDYQDLMPISRPQLSEEVPKASCPKCRVEFSILRSEVNGMKIEARLRFWDCLYEKLGISRSAKEEESRNDLLKYVQMFQMSGTEIRSEPMRSFSLQAQVSAMRFALRRGNRDLDPLQTYLRDAIFNLGCYGLHDGKYSATSYRNRRVPMWCCLVERIERGLSPLITPAMHWIRVLDNTDLAEQDRCSREFHRELKRKVFGPWRRALFADVGGNRDGLRWPAEAPDHRPD